MNLITVPEGVKVYDLGPDYYDRLTVVYSDHTVFSTTFHEDDYFHFVGFLHNLTNLQMGHKYLTHVPPHVLLKIQRMMP